MSNNHFGCMALAAIPAILGLGALYWLTFGEQLHGDIHTLKQEARAAEAVGAVPLPEAPVKIILIQKKHDPVFISRAWLDGNVIYVYYANSGKEKATNIMITYKFVSSNGTALEGHEWMASSWDGVDELDPGEKAEGHNDLAEADSRAVLLKLSIKSSRADGFSDWPK